MKHSLLLAQLNANLVVYLVVMAFFVMMFLSFIIMRLKNYRRCPPNRLMVIYGRGLDGNNAAKVIHGGAVFVVPLMQDYAYLSLDPMRLELPHTLSQEAMEKGVKLPQTWTFAVSPDAELSQHAAVRLLGLPTAEIMRLAEDLVAGRIEKQLNQLQNAIAPSESVTIVKQWAKIIDSDLAQVGLVTIGYR